MENFFLRKATFVLFIIRENRLAKAAAPLGLSASSKLVALHYSRLVQVYRRSCLKHRAGLILLQSKAAQTMPKAALNQRQMAPIASARD